MKRMIGKLALLLAVLILVSCMSVGTFAADKPVRQYGQADENGYGGYIALGDSVARGCGANGTDMSAYRNYKNRVVENSYPYTVAKAVGCTIVNDVTAEDYCNYMPVCFAGMTMSAAMDLLGIEDGYYDEVYDHGKTDFWYFPLMEEYYHNAGDFLANKASLVTIGFGLCDVAYAPIQKALATHEEMDADFVKDALKYMTDGFEYFKTAYPLLLDFIKENNPNATVVLVGNYNAGGDIVLSDELMLPIGQLLSGTISYMNLYLKQWAEEYGYIYCDIMNAETVAAQNDLGLLESVQNEKDWIYNGHLSVEGNAYVARQILSLLPEEIPEVTKDIVVDLGRFRSVDYVMLDGKLLQKNAYSMDGYELTIPYCSACAKVLTVAVVGERGKLSVYTYQLAFHADSGYSAYLISGVDDAANTTKKAAASVYNGAKTIVQSISGLFKR